MAIKERDIIKDWQLGNKFIMTKSWNIENGDCTDRYVGKKFILVTKHTDAVVFVTDTLKEDVYSFIRVPHSIAVTAFEKVEKAENKTHNSEYFTDNDFFNRALSKADIEVQTIFHKTTIVAVRFANGFVMVESSSCVTEQNYNKDLGIKLCIKKIEQKYMEHIAFEVCDDVYGWDSAEQETY